MLLQFVALCSCFVSPFAYYVLAQQPPSSPILNAEIDAFINGLLTDWNSPGGVSVAVVRKTGNDTWNVETKGYGVAKADGTNVTAQTLFAIGSNSKLFDILATGLLIANTSLDPRISWNTKIKTIIPEWGLMDPIATDEATIIDLMSHRSGLPRHDFMAKLSDDVLDVIGRLRFLRPSTEFRETLQYNNNMYTVLSYIPTAILPSKPKFTRYVKANIFEPLGLNSTTYSFDVANATGNLADGFFKQQTNLSASIFDAGIPRAIPFWAQVGGEDGHLDSGAGGVISNAVDMAAWLQTLLSGGGNAATKEVIIPPEAINMVSSGITVFESSPYVRLLTRLCQRPAQNPFYGSQHPFLSAAVYGGGQAQSTYRGHGAFPNSS
ncbi:hypothetical protein PLEOSDRAFT_1047810 [Pleurotus ostreatus PC15]|uniref:Beta-lactamase-related domain-containing protein n=1 Tax=Pleurotus ostreatus (strain PC15) TaxID=1137138 RepID=A0A067NKL2_PLEO1|nr:hypothetical protein PLEOSDRAFT_1047810 [Pleurotus ostreatus PC15]